MSKLTAGKKYSLCFAVFENLLYCNGEEALQNLKYFRCCHSSGWVDAVLGKMPFASEVEARAALDDCWSKLALAGGCIDDVKVTGRFCVVGHYKHVTAKDRRLAMDRVLQQDGR